MAQPILRIHESHYIRTETRHMGTGTPYTVDLCLGCGWCVCHYKEILDKPCKRLYKEPNGKA
jgi:hypothetical protein